MQVWEIHFCEGSYFAAKQMDDDCQLIDQTFTEPIGKLETTLAGIKLVLEMLTKAYELQKKFPIQ